MPAPTGFTAPAHILQKRMPPGSGGPGPYDAPSMVYLGQGLQDGRLPYNEANSPTGAGILGWQGAGSIKVISAAPSAISTTNMAAAQHTTSGTPLTLVTATGAGITVIPAGGQLSFPFLNTIPAGALAIDGAQGLTRFGLGFSTAFYNPSSAICRAVSVTAGAGATGGAVTIRGYDFYGQAMSQTVATVASTTVTTTKAFKYVVSATPAFTDGTGNYSVGTSDVFGLPLAADFFADVDVYWNNALVVASNFTPAVVTSPATATTGDTRGTISGQTGASNGTIRLDAFVAPSLSRLAQVPAWVGEFGVLQA